MKARLGKKKAPSSDAENIATSEVISKLVNASVSEIAKETEGTGSREPAN